MKEYEYFGVACTVVAYHLITTGTLTMGFQLGILASVTLFIYFASAKMWGMVGLQVYFFYANINGLRHLGDWIWG